MDRIQCTWRIAGALRPSEQPRIVEFALIHPLCLKDES